MRATEPSQRENESMRVRIGRHSLNVSVWVEQLCLSEGADECRRGERIVGVGHKPQPAGFLTESLEGRKQLIVIYRQKTILQEHGCKVKYKSTFQQHKKWCMCVCT